jgi:hypothetical protein
MASNASAPQRLDTTDLEPREAIIYLPSIGGLEVGESLDMMARRIARAFDDAAETATAEFFVRAGSQNEDYGGGGTTYQSRVCSIVRKDGDRAVPVVDLYELNYPAMLGKGFTQTGLIYKLGLVFLAVVLSLPLLIRAFFRAAPGRPRRRGGLPIRRHSRREQGQLLWAALILLLLSSYLVILVVAAVETILQLPEVGGQVASALGAAGERVKDAIEGITGQLPWPREGMGTAGGPTGNGPSLSPWQALSIILTSLGVAVPQHWRDSVSRVATIYTCVVNYMNLASKHGQVFNQLTLLLNHVETKKIKNAEGAEVARYSAVGLMGYSFGGIVALNALFPTTESPGPRFRVIDFLVTIGCPFYTIRSFWPHYFENRYGMPNKTFGWLNVYSPVDILSSDFGSEEGDRAFTLREMPGVKHPKPLDIDYAEPGTTHLTLLGNLALLGLRAHSKYWDRRDPTDAGCLRKVISIVYEGHPLLQ